MALVDTFGVAVIVAVALAYILIRLRGAIRAKSCPGCSGQCRTKARQGACQLNRAEDREHGGL